VLALDTRTENSAKSLEQLLQAAIALAPPAFKDGLGIELNPGVSSGTSGTGVTGPGARPGVPGVGPGGVAGLPMGPGGPTPGPSRPNDPSRTNTGGSSETTPNLRSGRLYLALRDKTVLVNLELSYPESSYRRLLREMEAYMVEVRG